MSARKSIGLGRRDLEWIVTSMVRGTPRDPAEAQKLMLEVVMALIEKNNAAIARELERDEGEGKVD